MKGWQFGLLLEFVAIILAYVIYLDAKGTNVLPWYVVFVDLILILLGLVIIRYSKK